MKIETGDQLYQFSHKRPANEVAIRLTSAGFGKEATDNSSKDIIKIIDDCDAFVVAKERTGMIVAGYIGYHLLRTSLGVVLYANTIMVDESYQGRGLAGMLIAKATEIEDPDYIGLRTQSARMYATAKKVLVNIQPDLSSQPYLDADVWRVGTEMAHLKGGTFPVTQGAYGPHPLYASTQEHQRYSTFYETVNFEDGDALYCIGRPPGSYDE